jgi:hypothetical protein
MNAPTVPADSIPTEQDEFVAFLVNFYRHSMVEARRAVEAYEDGQRLIPEDAQE